MSMKDSWAYIAEKGVDLRRQVFLLDGSFANRLQQVRANYLLFFLTLRAPDNEIQNDMDALRDRWLEIEETGFDELEISRFGNDLLYLIHRVERKYWGETRP